MRGVRSPIRLPLPLTLTPHIRGKSPAQALSFGKCRGGKHPWKWARFVPPKPKLKIEQVLVPYLGNLTGGYTTPDETGVPLKSVLFDVSHLGLSCQVCLCLCSCMCQWFLVLRVCVCVCVCVFIKLHITTQSGPVILVILCHSH